jgi:hypothetical protein
MKDKAMRRFSPRGWLLVNVILLGMMSSGCAALTNPLADAIPVRRVPPDFLGDSADALAAAAFECLPLGGG